MDVVYHHTARHEELQIGNQSKVLEVSLLVAKGGLGFENRQAHLDALRGVAALIVVVVHFFCVFFPYTVFGVQGEYLQHRAWEKLFYYPPLALLISGYSAVCLFFVLSGYVLSYRFLGESGVRSQLVAAMVKRPVRLGGVVLFTVLLGAGIWASGINNNVAVSEITSSKPYFASEWKGDFSLISASKHIFGHLFSSARVYNNPLWTIDTELKGSILIFAFLLLFGNAKFRLLYMTFLIIFFRNNEYQDFFFGMMAADAMKHGHLSLLHKFKKVLLYLLVIPAIYFFSYPTFTDVNTLATTWYAILPEFYFLGGSGYCGYPALGAFLIFALVCISQRLQLILQNKIFVYVGTISYSIYAVHFLVLGTFSSWLFPSQLKFLGYTEAFLSTFVISLVLIIIFAHFVTKYVDIPTTRISTWLGRQVVKGLELVFGQEKP